MRACDREVWVCVVLRIENRESIRVQDMAAARASSVGAKEGSAGTYQSDYRDQLDTDRS